MPFVIRIIIPALIPIVLGMILATMGKYHNEELIKNLKKEHIVLRLPKAYLWVGCLDISFFTACLFLMICFPNETATLWVKIGFCLFILLGVIIVFKALVWKIEIFRHADYFLIRTFFKVHTVHYNECTGYRITSNNLVLKTDKKKYRIDLMATNFEFLLSMLTQYKVPEIRNRIQGDKR